MNKFGKPAFPALFETLVSTLIPEVIFCMEVTIGDGEEAVQNATRLLQEKWPRQNWNYVISGRNAKPRDQRVDQYAAIYRGDIISGIQMRWPALSDAGNQFQNSIFTGRNPVLIDTVRRDFRATTCLYHAPNPSNQSSGDHSVQANMIRLLQLDEITRAQNAVLVIGDFNLAEDTYTAVGAEFTWNGFWGPGMPVADVRTTLPVGGITTWTREVPFVNPYDNFFYKDAKVTQSGIVDMSQLFRIFDNAQYENHQIEFVSDALWVFDTNGSDHMPIYLSFGPEGV